MTEKTWLSIAEYSSKYRISVSTLRRWIKTNDIKFQFEDGKYFLNDSAPVENRIKAADVAPPPQKNVSPKVEVEKLPVPASVTESAQTISNNITNQLLAEIKKAYAIILQEKEEQIIQLKEEVTDLKTLVRVLESENQRLQSVDSWIKDIESGPAND